MFVRKVSLARAVCRPTILGPCVYTLREWLNIDKVVRHCIVRGGLLK